MRKFLYFLIFLLLMCSLVYIFHKEILKEYALFFEVDNGKKNACAIIILAGNPYTRIESAVRFYKDGYAKEIYLTTPKAMAIKEYDFLLSQNEIAKKVLLHNGIDNFKQIPSLKNGATSTLDEAYDSADYFKNRDIRRVILVTDSFHTRRSYHAFEKIFKEKNIDIIIEAKAAKNSLYDETNWWRVEAGIADYVLESIKTILYLFISQNSTLYEES